MASSDFAIGHLATSELDDAGALVAESGWNQVATDWRIFLAFGTVYAIRDAGRVVATAATLPYGKCAWISMVLVAGTHRRRGLATQLLNRCIADIQASGLIPALDATPAGRTVYAPLGFQECWGFARFAAQARALIAPPAPIVVQSVSDAVWPALCAYDARAFGADRGHVLDRMRGRLPAANLFATRDDKVTGLLLGREGRTASHLGPLIAEDDATAIALLHQAIGAITGTVYVDVADAKGEVRRWLEASGFTIQRPFTRMLLGQSHSLDDLTRTYAVIGPEFG